MAQNIKQDWVTVENLTEFQTECFSFFASRKRVEIGCSAFGSFVVRKDHEIWHFKLPENAIKKYTELIQ